MTTLILILEIAALLLAIKIAFWLLYACVVGTIYLISQSGIPQFFRDTLNAINFWITYDIPQFFQNALNSLSVAGTWLLSRLNIFHRSKPKLPTHPTSDLSKDFLIDLKQTIEVREAQKKTASTTDAHTRTAPHEAGASGALIPANSLGAIEGN